MNFIIGYLVKKLGVSVVVIFLKILYLAFVTAYFIFIINALHTVVGIIQGLFSKFQNGGGVNSIFWSHFVGYLDAIGFLSAVQTTYPLIISSIVFLLTSILYKYSKSAYKSYVDAIASSSMGGGLF